MVYPGLNDQSEDSASHILKPIDVGLRGEHYLDSEMGEPSQQLKGFVTN